MASDVNVPVGKMGGSKLHRKLTTVARHVVLTGTPGWGKSAQAISMFLAIRQANPNVSWVFLDPKPDIVPTLRDEVIPALYGTGMAIDPNRVINIDPFGPYGVGLNPLIPMPDVAVEAQAHVVTTIISSLSLDGLGQRGTAILAWLARGLIPLTGTLLDAARMLADERYRLAVANRVADAEVRKYLCDGFTKEPSASISSLKTRLEWCLLLPQLRAALCADHAVDGQQLLNGPVTLISTGGAPAGFAAASRMLGGLLFALLSAAIFARKIEEETHLVIFVVDEAHEVLKASGILDDFERVLTQARQRRVALWSITQCLSQLQHSSLIESIKANISLHFAFRPDSTEVRHLLPLARTSGTVVDPRRPDRRLTPAEERELLTTQLGRLPPRHFALADYVGGTLEVAKSLTIPFADAKERAQALPVELRTAFLRGRIGIPAAEMARRAARPVAAVADEPPRDTPLPESAPPRRPKRPKLELPE